MAKRAQPISARRAQTAVAVDRPLLLADGHNLYLRIEPGGARSWIFRYQIRGRRHDMGLGSYATFSLAEARERAREARKLVADGIDPLDRRRQRVTAAAVS